MPGPDGHPLGIAHGVLVGAPSGLAFNLDVVTMFGGSARLEGGNTTGEAAIHAGAAAGVCGAIRTQWDNAGGVLPASAAAPDDVFALAAEAEAGERGFRRGSGERGSGDRRHRQTERSGSTSGSSCPISAPWGLRGSSTPVRANCCSIR